MEESLNTNTNKLYRNAKKDHIQIEWQTKEE